MFTRKLLAVLWLGYLAISPLGKVHSDWTAWRGTGGNGYASEGAYPVKLDAENTAWQFELPGKGCSTPIILDGNIYLTAPVDNKDAVLCVNSAGQETWRTVFAEQNAGKHRNGSGSNASPVTDGHGVFVYFKSGTFAALELNGSVRWQTDLVERFGKDTLFWDHGTSPVLTEKYVVMARMHNGESWLAAFDKQTGEIAWKVARNFSTPMECDHGYTTPQVIRHQGKEAVLVWGAEHVTIHNASNGEVVWSCGNFNPEGTKLWPAVASPVIADNMAVIAYGRNDRGQPKLFGIRLDGQGDVTATNHVWKREDVGTFVPTPAVFKGNILLVRDKGEVDCLEPATGKTLWSNAFPKGRSAFYASPIVADGKLYAVREDGMVFVASLDGKEFKLLSENNLAEPVIGSPVATSNRLLIRGEKHLFCFSTPTLQPVNE